MHETAHEAAGVVTAAQGFAGKMDAGGLLLLELGEGFAFAGFVAARWRVSLPAALRAWLSRARQAGLTWRVVSAAEFKACVAAEAFKGEKTGY